MAGSIQTGSRNSLRSAYLPRLRRFGLGGPPCLSIQRRSRCHVVRDAVFRQYLCVSWRLRIRTCLLLRLCSIGALLPIRWDLESAGKTIRRIPANRAQRYLHSGHRWFCLSDADTFDPLLLSNRLCRRKCRGLSQSESRSWCSRYRFDSCCAWLDLSGLPVDGGNRYCLVDTSQLKFLTPSVR